MFFSSSYYILYCLYSLFRLFAFQLAKLLFFFISAKFLQGIFLISPLISADGLLLYCYLQKVLPVLVFSTIFFVIFVITNVKFGRFSASGHER